MGPKSGGSAKVIEMDWPRIEVMPVEHSGNLHMTTRSGEAPHAAQMAATALAEQAEPLQLQVRASVSLLSAR
jgi:hypothetical protein